MAGIQPDCYEFNHDKYNVCLELNSIDMATAYATGLCTQTCTATRKTGSCGLGNLPIRTGFFDVNWMTNALEAKKKIEKLIVKDVLNPFSPLAELPNMIYTSISSTSFIVDDILIRVSEGPPPPSFATTAVVTTSIQKSLVSPTNGNSYAAICNIVLFGSRCDVPPNYTPYIGTPALTDTIFHEYLHCLGLLLTNNQVRTYRQTDALGRRIWTGPAAIQAWRDLGCTGDIPLEQLGAPHLEGKCFFNEILSPSISQGQNQLFSDVSAGMISDLGYTVNYKATDKVKRSNLLNLCACGDFCPSASAKCARRLNDPKTVSSRRKHKSSRRRLDPIANIPSDTTRRAQATASLSQEQLAELQYIRSLSCAAQNDPLQDADCNVHLMMVGQDGTFVDKDYTMDEVAALIAAQGSSNSIVV